MDRISVKRQLVREALENRFALGASGRLQVGHVMSVAPMCISPETSVLELVRLFNAKGFRHLLVADHAGSLVGLISDRDVIRFFGPQDRPDREVLDAIPALKVMSTDLITVSPTTPLDEAVEIMIAHGISSLPVLAGTTLVGIVTNTDLQITLGLMLAPPVAAVQGADATVA